MNFRQVHLDFHTSEKIKNIGKLFNKEEFQKALVMGHIDSITLFSKCHHGWSYHPTNVNKMHPCLDFDLLKAQMDAAHEIGVKTPVYISAGLDEKCAKEHLNWMMEDVNHTFDNFSVPMYHSMCMNTPYLDYLLAQIKEVCENYKPDGLFLDLVGIRPCCCRTCMQEMLDNGMNPNNPNDVLKLGEKTYLNYLKRVRETVDSVMPGLPVFHNGGHISRGKRNINKYNTHFEIESLPTGGWGYDNFPVSAKYCESLGAEYLGMTGKFHTTWAEFGGFKHPNALIYETALFMAFGAKCSIGDQLYPNGKIDFTTYDMIGRAYQRVEEREKWLDNTTSVNEIAVLSAEACKNYYNDTGEDIYTDSDVGALRILIEGKYQFAFIDYDATFDGYKVIILPDNIKLNADLITKLNDFANKGGKILATGDSPIINGEFVPDFGARYVKESEFKPSYIRPSNNNPYESDFVMYSKGNIVKATDGKSIGKFIAPYFNRTAEHFCSHLHTPSSGEIIGDGIIIGGIGAYIAWDIFSDYAQHGEMISKTVVCDVLDILLNGEKLVKTDLQSHGIATLRKQNKKLILHLIYAQAGVKGKSIEAIEDIYPIYDVNVEIRTDKKPDKVYLVPEMNDVSFEFENGYTKFVVSKIDCHQMIVIE